MDISLNFNNQKLNYRIAVIINYNNHVLLQTDDKCDFWVLPGGRCKSENLYASISIMWLVRFFFFTNFTSSRDKNLLIWESSTGNSPC